jgi:hypothetical protein
MHQPRIPPRQRQLFDLTPDECAQLLGPDRRDPCRALLVQLLQAARHAEAAERKTHERQDQSEAS